MAEITEHQKRLWKVAKRIVEMQIKATTLPDEDKKIIDWEGLEVEWFDFLEEELFPELTA